MAAAAPLDLLVSPTSTPANDPDDAFADELPPDTPLVPPVVVLAEVAVPFVGAGAPSADVVFVASWFVGVPSSCDVVVEYESSFFIECFSALEISDSIFA